MKIAILDYDNTLSDGFTRYELGYQMEKEGIIEKGLKNEIEELQAEYESDGITYNQKFKQDKEIFGRYYKGLKRRNVSKYVEKNFDFASKIYPWSHELISQLQENGYLVIVLTGCWDFIMEHAQKVLNFDSFFATEFEMEDDEFNGNFRRIIDYKAKDRITKELLLDTKGHTLGIGDSTADLEFLKQVDDAFMYSPREDALNQIENRNLEDHIKVVDRDTVLQAVFNTI